MANAADPATEFVLPRHVAIFERAARQFDVYVLLRKTGRHSLRWVGHPGYTSKRADMKCKTADAWNHPLAGLVCSPRIHPAAFSAGRIDKAAELWDKSQHLISIPRDRRTGFKDTEQPKYPSPYLLQTNSAHARYGCIAWIEGGLVKPRYVHGDYDLYAIVPRADPAVRGMHDRTHSSGLTFSSLPLERNLKLSAPVADYSGPLQFALMNHLDAEIGYPMVMHGEAENFEPAGEDESLLVFLPASRTGLSHIVLNGNAAIDQFYATELRGRRPVEGKPVTRLYDALSRPVH